MAQRLLFDPGTEDVTPEDESDEAKFARYQQVWAGRTEENTATVLSYSGGTSSEWPLQAMLRGIIRRPERFAVCMADTGEEHEWTYDRAAYVAQLCKDEGIPFLKCKDERQTLGDHLIAKEGTHIDQPPLWFKTGTGHGRAANRCTGRWKVAPMRRAVSQWLSETGQPKRVIKWIGFGADENWRATKAVSKAHRDVQWEALAFPGIRYGVTRGQQQEDLKRWTGSTPLFSQCIHCPHKNDDRWRQTPATQLKRVFAIDEAVRDLSERGFDQEAYLSSALIPVRQLLKTGRRQQSLPHIDGGCDGGHCML